MIDNPFKGELIKLSSALSSMIAENGEFFKLATSIVDDADDASALTLVQQTAEIIKSKEYSKDVKRIASLLKDRQYEVTSLVLQDT